MKNLHRLFHDVHADFQCGEQVQSVVIIHETGALRLCTEAVIYEGRKPAWNGNSVYEGPAEGYDILVEGGIGGSQILKSGEQYAREKGFEPTYDAFRARAELQHS